MDQSNRAGVFWFSIFYFFQVASLLLEHQSSLFKLPIAIANCFARGLKLLQISSTLQVGLQAEVFRLSVTLDLALRFLCNRLPFEPIFIFTWWSLIYVLPALMFDRYSFQFPLNTSETFNITFADGHFLLDKIMFVYDWKKGKISLYFRIFTLCQKVENNCM